MSKSLSEFLPIPRQPDLWSARKGNLRCTALRLRDDSLCLYSPVRGAGDVARSSLAALGEVAFLLAPNHYHHKGLVEYAETFPDAALLCSEPASPRLEKQTGLSFEGLRDLVELLPDDCEAIEPEGLKTGEVWLIKGSGEDLVWVVCDALKGPSGTADRVGARIEMLGTFPTYGIQDERIYSAWVKDKLTTHPPNMVAPCHGQLVESENLAGDIEALLA